VKRETAICLLLTIAALAGGLVLACAKDKADKDEPVYCMLPLKAWMDECGFTVQMDGINEMTLDEAYDSCKNGYGKTWQNFLHCYHEFFLKQGRSCEAFAECAPEHGLSTDDDSAADDDDASPADDDTTPADDDTTPADDDTSPADDDTTPADDDTTPADDDTSPTD
jgi:hypothetical protein